MKNIETYLTLGEYLTSIATGDHKAPNVAQIGDVGEEYYRYDKNAITQQSNPVLYNIAISAGWNISSETAVTNNELALVNEAELMSAINGNSSLTTFNEFRYFDGISFISKATFSGCTSIREIVIPESVKVIENGAFDSFPSNVKIVYEGKKSDITFVEKPYINTTFAIPTDTSNLRVVGASNISTFKNYFSYIEVSGVGINTSISSGKFTAATLNHVVSGLVPDSTLYIKYYPKRFDVNLPTSGFSDLTQMVSVEIPETFGELLGDSMFSFCYSLKTISLPSNMKVIPRNTFLGCSGLTSIEIPNSVTEIQNYAFNQCVSLTNITLPGELSILGEHCFAYSTSLKNIVIPNSVSEIGNYCFYNCSGLTGVVLSNSVSAVPIACFSGCRSIKNITLPSSVTKIDQSAFAYCYGLVDIAIPDSIENIQNNAYYNCLGVTGITIGTGVTYIAFNSFSGIKILSSDLVNNSSYTSSAPWGATLYDSGVIKSGKFYLSGANGELLLRCMTDAVDVTIPNSVTGISSSAFCRCVNLSSVTFHSNVTSLSAGCFYGCESLRDVPDMPGIDTIPYGCFYYCYGLVDITIPSSITNISSNAFAQCKNLERVTFSSSALTTIGTAAFDYAEKLKTIDASVFPVGCPSINRYTFQNIGRNGVLIVGRDAHFGTWMSTEHWYLGYLSWTLSRV